MKMISIILRKPPYGAIEAAEAVRHALGAVSDDISVKLILVDSGVLLARHSQDVGSSGFTDLGETLKDCIEMGVSVYADRVSLSEYRLDGADIMDGIITASGSEISEMLVDSHAVMIY